METENLLWDIFKIKDNCKMCITPPGGVKIDYDKNIKFNTLIESGAGFICPIENYLFKPQNINTNLSNLIWFMPRSYIDWPFYKILISDDCQYIAHSKEPILLEQSVNVIVSLYNSNKYICTQVTSKIEAVKKYRKQTNYNDDIEHLEKYGNVFDKNNLSKLLDKYRVVHCDLDTYNYYAKLVDMVYTAI